MGQQPAETELDPMRGAFRWAWKRGLRHLDRFVVGAVVFGIAGLLGRQVRDHQQPLLVLVVSVLAALAAAFGWALVRAPFEQRDALRKTTNNLRQQIQGQSPDLLGTVNMAIAGYVPDKPSTTITHINLTVLNRGAPSVVRSWALFATIGQVRREVPIVMIPDGTELRMTNGAVLRVGSSDAIYQKGTARLERGAQISGWLRGEVAEIRHDQFLATGTSVEVSFQDFVGKSYTATAMLGVGGIGFQYIPGSNRPEAFQGPTKEKRKRRRS